MAKTKRSTSSMAGVAMPAPSAAVRKNAKAVDGSKRGPIDKTAGIAEALQRTSVPHRDGRTVTASTSRSSTARQRSVAPAQAGLVRIHTGVIRPIDRSKVIEAIDAATAAGQEIVVIARASAAEMTSQEAADFLRVSRPHMTKLADQGVVPSRMVGTHRRFRLDDLVRYDETTRSVRHNALDQLFAESDEYQTGDV